MLPKRKTYKFELQNITKLIEDLNKWADIPRSSTPASDLCSHWHSYQNPTGLLQKIIQFKTQNGIVSNPKEPK